MAPIQLDEIAYNPRDSMCGVEPKSKEHVAEAEVPESRLNQCERTCGAEPFDFAEGKWALAILSEQASAAEFARCSHEGYTASNSP